MSDFLGEGVTNTYVSMLLALRGGGWVSNFQKKVLINTLVLKHFNTLNETARSSKVDQSAAPLTTPVRVNEASFCAFDVLCQALADTTCVNFCQYG